MVLFKEVLEKSCDGIEKRGDKVVGTCYFDTMKKRRFDAEDMTQEVSADNAAKFSEKYDLPHSTFKEKIKETEGFQGFG